MLPDNFPKRLYSSVSSSNLLWFLFPFPKEQWLFFPLSPLFAYLICIKRNLSAINNLICICLKTCKFEHHFMFIGFLNLLFYELLICAVLCLAVLLCLTLCDPMDCSPPGFSVHRDSLGKNTGVGCHALL